MKKLFVNSMIATALAIGGISINAQPAQADWSLGLGCSGGVYTNGSWYNWRTNCTADKHKSRIEWSGGGTSVGNCAAANNYSNLYWYVGTPVSYDVQFC
jgi:hypothetical protein